MLCMRCRTLLQGCQLYRTKSLLQQILSLPHLDSKLLAGQARFRIDSRNAQCCATRQRVSSKGLDRHTTVVRRLGGALFTKPAKLEMSWTYHAFGISETAASPQNTNECLSSTVYGVPFNAHVSSRHLGTHAQHGKSTAYH
jgi:hypothetical protein